jgi:ABC transporter substrate binding protein
LTVLKLRPAAFAFSTAVGSSFPRAPPREIVSFAAAHRLPAVYGARDFVSDGGLMSYDANIKDIWCRAAFYIDKILKGTKPADLADPTIRRRYAQGVNGNGLQEVDYCKSRRM